ncbi:MAG: polysaccharide biosynthesis C-terminal domain-containing protein [Chlamydiia bacterium]|nr:polysaccharide biosynthesis C-terminal domain-containing protein [Chlamydiia bacterium]
MSTIATANKHALSNYRAGSIGETLALFFPLLLSVFSGSIMHFCDRLFISHYSLSSLKALTAANYYILFFQFIVARIVTTSRVCIGRSYGEKNFGKLGPYCWQMIWFSILSMGITLPVGFGLIPMLFQNTDIALEGSAYFKILLFGNFLFPLGTALSSYFIGLGKTRVVALTTFAAQLVNIGLNYLLIFGALPIVPSLGIKGAAFGTVFAQALLCLALLFLFLNGNASHNVRKLLINWPLLKEVLFLGIPRVIGTCAILICWNLVVLLITRLEGDYLLVLSIGSSVWLTYSPLTTTLQQVITSQVSFYRGQKAYATIWRSIRSSLYLLITLFVLFGLGILLFLDPFLSLFIHEPLSHESLRYVKLSFIWLWVYFLMQGLNQLHLGLTLGLEQTWFSLKVTLITIYPTGYLPFYLGFTLYHLGPDKLYLLCSISIIVVAPILFLRGKKVIEKLKNEDNSLRNLQPA